MIKRLLYASIVLLGLMGSVHANDIYIEQVGDNLDLDIVQDGQNNVIGTSLTALTLGAVGVAADDMTFNITQRGDSNTIAATIMGNDYTGTWSFTGDSNSVALQCDTAQAGNCETVTLNITGTGDTQNYTINIGQSADSKNTVANFTVTGDGHVITTDIDGVAATVAVTVTDNSSLTTTANTLDIDITGDGDVSGHSQTLEVNGRGNTVTVSQSGVYDNTVDLDMTGDNGAVDITQSD
jgi:hypothetical protein